MLRKLLRVATIFLKEDEFMAWLLANWVHLIVAVLAVAEIASMFLPGASGTLAGVIGALASLPGVKDPQIGK
jgi:hypothetical protein